MDMPQISLAVDIGASSGKMLLGWVEEGRLLTEEVWRFPNGAKKQGGRRRWDVDGLFDQIVQGLAHCAEIGKIPSSVGIDTWAVDFVLIGRDGRRLGDAVCYRDHRTDGMDKKLLEILSEEELYARTGIQKQIFNTIYQLLAVKEQEPELLEQAEHLLLIPDYLHYRLTGQICTEYTNATTTALVNAHTRDWDWELIDRLGLPRRLFCKLVQPGERLGDLLPDVARRAGYSCSVVLPATHDTGSAVLAVPAQEENFLFLSSGTWSLIGMERCEPDCSAQSRAANFTNEGGYGGTIRYLKNIMGLWMIQSVRRELGEKTGTRPSFPELIAAAKEAADFPSCVDPDDNRFLAPASMIEEVRAACADTHQPVPAATGEVMQCVYNSLTQDYRRAVENLQSLTGKTYTSLNIVGGGSQDGYLNQQTANATGLTVFAGPTEGTALGNLMVQFIHSGDFADLAEARAAIRRSFEIKEYQPE